MSGTSHGEMSYPRTAALGLAVLGSAAIGLFAVWFGWVFRYRPDSGFGPAIMAVSLSSVAAAYAVLLICRVRVYLAAAIATAVLGAVALWGWVYYALVVVALQLRIDSEAMGFFEESWRDRASDLGTWLAFAVIWAVAGYMVWVPIALARAYVGTRKARA